MAQFEDYTEKTRNRQKDFFYIEQLNTQLPEYEMTAMPYDVEQLTEKMNRRMAQTTWEERTAYYFTDTKVLQAKSNRYRNISEGGKRFRFRGISAEKMAERYTNHSANKRRKRAGEAADSFEEAADLTEQLNKKQKGMTPGVLFKERERIMRLRMKGMMKAAEAKSKSGQHEAYLKYKAQISCLTILSEQAERLLEQADEERDRKSFDLLKTKSKALEKELTKAKKGMEKVAPSVEETWQKEHGITDERVDQRRREESARNSGMQIQKEDVKLLMQLEALKGQMEKGEMDYPCHIVRLDRNGEPVNYAEKHKQNWNETYQKARKEGDQQLKGAAQDIISRVEQYPFPSLKELEEKGPLTLFREHPAQYYEMFVQAPKYFRTEGKENPILTSYGKEHPYFKAKCELMELLSRWMLQEMRHHHIDPENAKLLKPEEKAEEPEKEAVKPEEKAVKKLSLGEKIQAAYRSLNEAETRRENELRGGRKARITRRDREEELADYRKINPSFTAKQQQLLTELKGGVSELDNSDLTERAGKMIPKKRDGIIYKQIFSVGLHMVHRDKNRKPLTGEDQKNHAHNEAWIKAFEDGDIKTQNAMIRQEFDSMFRDLELPDGEHFAEWMQNKLEEDPAGLHVLYRKLLDLEYMIENNETARKYKETHPEFMQCYDLIYPALNKLLTSGIGAKLAIRHSLTEEMKPLTKEEQEACQIQFQSDLAAEAASYKEKYEKYFSGFAEIKEDNPEVNEMDYRILQIYKISGATITRYEQQMQEFNAEELEKEKARLAEEKQNQAQEKQEDKTRNQKSNWTLDQTRNLSIGLHMYRTNQEGEPDTEEDREIAEKNQKWIDAWKKKDENKICEILDPELEECYKGITMPEPEHLIEWLQDQVENHTASFSELIRRNVGVDNIMTTTPALREHLEKYWEAHPQYKVTGELLIAISTGLPAFYKKYYHIKVATHDEPETTFVTRGDYYNDQESYDNTLADMIGDYKIAYNERLKIKQPLKQ